MNVHRNENYFVFLPFDATQAIRENVLFLQTGEVISMTGYFP
jgi:hypothetical protein